jgi:hypothetical protein
MYGNHAVDAGDYEYSVFVPSLYVAPNDDPNIIIRISAHGGGTVGEAYAHNGWTYSVEVAGTEVITGDDIRSNATPATHAGMARTLAGFLSAAGESLRYSGDRSEYAAEYSGSAREFLGSEYERLAMFSDEPGEPGD